MRYLLVLISLFLFSCSGLSKEVRLELSSIELGATSSIEGAEFYHHLLTLLQPQAETKYLLNFTFEETLYDLAISKSSDVMRKGIEQVVKFELIDKRTDKILLKDLLRLHSSYSLSIEPLTSYAQMDTNRKFLARRAAETIRYKLIHFLHQNQSKAN